MEPCGSLLCSQEVTAVPYPEPDESSSHSTIFIFNIPFNIILCLHLCLRNWFFRSGFSIKIMYTSLPSVFYPEHFI
jgi:hypothetical protein